VAGHFLLRSQQNEVFAAIQAEGLNPAEFDWSTRFSPTSPGVEVPVLTHKPSAATYIFDWEGLGHLFGVHIPELPR